MTQQSLSALPAYSSRFFPMEAYPFFPLCKRAVAAKVPLHHGLRLIFLSLQSLAQVQSILQKKLDKVNPYGL